jgi:ABC-type nitrate/sulfonate/bicarbonate transport system substrate-binding protein
MANPIIKIGGVPEHFNLPWQLAFEDDAFEKAGIDLQWQDIPEGTGRMSQMLRNGELDVACILTDGIVKDIIAGNDSRILQVYVSSPLLWGVHTWAENPVKETQNMASRRFAISRFGSGSHLMSYLLASKYAWKLEKLDFRLVDTIEGAIRSLSSREADLFLWERYMTQPIVDKGIFKRLETIAPPWPSFVIAARQDCIGNHEILLAKMLQVINRYTADFKDIPSIDRTIAAHYDLEVGDVQQWMLRTQFSDDQLWDSTISKIIEDFTAVGIIERKVGADELIHNLPKIDEEE